MARPDFPWRFPYVIEKHPEDHPLGRTLMRPAAEARLVGPGNRVGQRVFALMDSGADYTMAAGWMAQEVGIDLTAGRETTVQIGGKPRVIRVVDATLRLCPPSAEAGTACDEDSALTWTAEVGFFTQWEAPPWLIILGQTGFFDQFTVVMSRYSQGVAVEPMGRFDELYGELEPGPMLTDPPSKTY